MFLPLNDENPLRIIPFQVVTVSIMTICIVALIYKVTLPEHGELALSHAYGFIPAVYTDTVPCTADICPLPSELTIVTAMFIHAGWLHLLGNMLFLWIYGDNVEDSMGHIKFLNFYLLCGAVAALIQAVSDPGSEAPMIGASGAIGGVLGAYLMLHPRVRVLVLVLPVLALRIPAFIVIGLWVISQVVAIAFQDASNVAFWAHLGGFAAGAALIPFFKRRDVPLFDGNVAH